MKTLDFTTLSPCDGTHINKLKANIMKEEDYIEKQEILDAIRDGLLEIRDAKLNGRELMNAEDLLNEL